MEEITQQSASTSEKPAFAVHEVCETLGVSRSGFYAHQHKDQRPRRQQDRVLTGQIRNIFEQSQRSYGSPRLVRELKKQGVRTSKTRVRRLMKREGLCPIQKRRRRIRTTQSNPHLPVAPHLLLDAPPAHKPGLRFYSDITYIPTQEGWLFMAATLDGYSRKCAGWSAAGNMETPLVLRAAERAFAQTHQTHPTLGDARIHHSDRGSQYASAAFRDFLKEHQVEQSMSRKGNCYDNAMMESFWATLKTECFDNFRGGIPATRQEAKQKLFAYIEVFYNRKRLHSSLGYSSPVEFEMNHQQNLHKEKNLFLSLSS
jgi:putative transposase